MINSQVSAPQPVLVQQLPQPTIVQQIPLNPIVKQVPLKPFIQQVPQQVVIQQSPQPVLIKRLSHSQVGIVQPPSVSIAPQAMVRQLSQPKVDSAQPIATTVFQNVNGIRRSNISFGNQVIPIVPQVISAQNQVGQTTSVYMTPQNVAKPDT